MQSILEQIPTALEESTNPNKSTTTSLNNKNKHSKYSDEEGQKRIMKNSEENGRGNSSQIWEGVESMKKQLENLNHAQRSAIKNNNQFGCKKKYYEENSKQLQNAFKRKSAIEGTEEEQFTKLIVKTNEEMEDVNEELL